ncbi:MAG: hypothetical protein ABSC22_07065 [Roseiarcus sp.]|jgi:hypothetical protein
MPDAFWAVFGDPANGGMLALAFGGVAMILAGPWAIIKFASRGSGKPSED